nr:reverse transcriptase domain-containing protein [Tanacetum cinerariifolium]
MMADQRTMAELLRAPIEGYAEAIVVPSILAEYKDLLCACPHHGFTELHQLDTFYNALNLADQDSLNSAVGGNLLERRTQDVLTIIENKSKARNSRNKSVVSQVKSSDANSNSSSEIAKLTHAVNQQTDACLSASGNTFPKLKDNIQGYVAATAVNYNQGNSVYRPAEEDECVEETLTDQDLAEYTIKVPPHLVQKFKPPFQRNFFVLQRDPLHRNIPCPSRMLKQKQQEKDEVQIYKFWQMFKQLHINITLVDALILIPKYQKILKALLSNKEKLLELANTPFNENCSAVILKKLPEKLRDPGKFLIPCGFNKLKCKALADLGASINLMPLSVWKKLGLPKLISTRMTLELANRVICTPAGIARDVFVPVGKFTFLADFVIVDYESDPRVPLILRRPFLWTARALIDVHREEMILRDGDERLTLNMRHDTSSYSNQPQKESINMINVFNDLSEDFLENLFSTNHQSGNPTFSSHPDTTSSSSPNQLLEEFVDELALITFPPGNNDLQFDIESNLKEIEYLLHHDLIKDIDSILKDSIDQSNLVDLNDNLVDSMPEMFTDEHALDYSSPPLYDEYDDDLFEVESDTEYVYDDPFDSKGEKINEFKLLIDKLDLLYDFLLPSEYDLFFSKDFSEIDALLSTNNEGKTFKPGILIQENIFEVITRVALEKNEKKLAIYHASSILEDFDPPLYELPCFKEVPRSVSLDTSLCGVPKAWSLIGKFWQTATASTNDNGETEINPTIDERVKIVSEASIRRHLKLEDSDGISNLPNTEIFEQLALMGNMRRASKGYAGVDIPLFPTMIVQGLVVQGEGSTHSVESHHTPTSAPSTSPQQISPTSRSPIREETEVPRPSSPPHTHVVDEAASISVDDRIRGATTTITGLEAGQGSGNINKTPSIPYDSPLLRGYTLGIDGGRMQHNDMMDLVTKLLDKVDNLETKLKQTKQTYSAAFTKLIKKVKTLEKTVKSSQGRRRARMVVSDDEKDLEDPSKQERKIAEIDEDPNISLIQHDAEVHGRHVHDMELDFKFTAAEEVYTVEPDVSTAEQVSTANVPVTTVGVEIITACPEVKTAGVFIDEITIKNLVYIRRVQQRQKIKVKLRRYSFEQIRNLFEATMKRVNTFTPIESDVTVPKVAAGSSKRDAEEELIQESLKRQKTRKSLEPVKEPKDKEEELSQEELQQMMIAKH